MLYYALPDDFEPAKAANQAALALLARFVSNGREADGAPTRERLKLIARCVFFVFVSVSVFVCARESAAKKPRRARNTHLFIPQQINNNQPTPPTTNAAS